MWVGASFLRFFVRHSVIQTLTMGNKGPDLVLKQGNDRNQISLFRNREKNRAGTEGPLAAPNLPSPPRLPAPPWPFRPKQPTSGGPPAPIRVPDHTLGPPRETESAVGPEYPLGKSSSRATEKAPDKLLGKCQQEGGPDISGAPSPLCPPQSVSLISGPSPEQSPKSSSACAWGAPGRAFWGPRYVLSSTPK